MKSTDRSTLDRKTMRRPATIRSLPGTLLGLCLLTTPFGLLPAQSLRLSAYQAKSSHVPPPPHNPQPAARSFPRPNAQQRRNQPHLQQWMASHRNLSPQEQQNALEAEPGFRELPPQTQQRMRDRLAQLNALPPQQRERMLQNTERMEQLAPEQRQQVRGAMSQWNSLPPDQRRAVGQAFRQLRALPPADRMAALDDRYRGQFTAEEHDALTHLLSVEPLLPPPANRAATPQQ